MIIDFKFDYEADVVLNGGRVPKKIFIEGQMSVDIKSITRDDTNTIAVTINENHLRDYVSYDDSLYTPVEKNNIRIPGIFRGGVDRNDYTQLDDVLISNLPEGFKDKENLKRVCGIGEDDIHHFDDIYYLNDFFQEKNRLPPDKKIKLYHGDNRTFTENKIKNLLEKFIFIDGELYRKSIGPVFQVDLDVPVIENKNIHYLNCDSFYDSNLKKFYTHFPLDYSTTHVIRNMKESRIFNPVGVVPPTSYDFLQDNGNYNLNLTIDMLNFYIYDDKKINSYHNNVQNFHIFDMEFLIKQNSPYYGEILFNQIMDFKKTFIKNTPENFEQYFLTLKEKYPFGDELYFLIKNCQNDTTIENVDELATFVENNFNKIKTKPTIYKDNSIMSKNNLNYTSDKDFLSPLLNASVFLNNYKNMRDMDADTYLSTKIGDTISTTPNKKEVKNKL